MHPLILQAIVGFISAALGALVAGYAGVWFGLAKLRRERAFERRLEWYTKTIGTMREIVSKTMMIQYVPDARLRTEMAKQIADATTVFHQLLGESRLYITRRGEDALARVTGHLDDIAPGLRGSPEQQQKAQEESLAVLRYGMHVLTNDVRRQLGIGELEPPRMSKMPMPAPVRKAES